MGALVDNFTAGWFTSRDLEDGYAEYIKVRHIFGRMEIAQTQIMPWLLSAIPNSTEKSVLEIGCGTGSATVPLARAFQHLKGFDLSAESVELAKRRCAMLGIDNVTLFSQNSNWTREFAENPMIFGEADVIVCYALLEHLLPLERIDLLIGAWGQLKTGGYLVVIETPNRLYPFDWHSMQMPFADQTPAELAYLWAAFSGRGSIPGDIKAKTRKEVVAGSRERMYRFGRGASFHEFHCVLGAENYEIANQAVLDRSNFAGFDREDIASLERQLRAVTPPVDPLFAQPVLDLVIRKTGAARLGL
ncbi:MAG: class I SAM-dependent methyltransferase [Hyphomonadaceae bacterium]